MERITYNIILFTGDIRIGNNGFVTYHKVNSIDKFKVFADSKYCKWVFMTVYNHATKEKIEVIRNT